MSVRKVALIQARTRSNRYERKVLKEIDGFPVYVLVFERIKKSLNEVYFVIPKGDTDLKVELIKSGYPFFEGPEEDVLRRYFLASQELSLRENDIVVRATADNPLVCPGVVKKTLKKALEADYTASSFLEGFTLGIGVEAFTFKMLREADKRATSLYQREHVTPYIRENAPIKKFPEPKWYEAVPLRLTLDYFEDHLFLNLLFKLLKKNPMEVSMKDIASLWKKNPLLADYSKRLFSSAYEL